MKRNRFTEEQISGILKKAGGNADKNGCPRIDGNQHLERE